MCRGREGCMRKVIKVGFNFSSAKRLGQLNIVCTPPSLSAGEVAPPTQFSKRGEGIDRISVFRGWLLGKRGGGDFFQGGCNFYIKNKLTSEMFDDKKVYKQCFSRS